VRNSDDDLLVGMMIKIVKILTKNRGYWIVNWIDFMPTKWPHKLIFYLVYIKHLTRIYIY